MIISEARRGQMLAPPQGRLRMVLDTDTYNEIDDQFAVVQAMLSPEKLKVEAIYAVPFQNARSSGPAEGMELSYQEILRVLTRLQISSEGLAFRGVKEFVGLGRQARDADAVDDLIGRARAGTAADLLYVVAIGALSNVASALLKAPDIIDRIVVVWLGGNLPEWPAEYKLTAEFNLIQDIGAAQVVFDSGVPMVLLPAFPVTCHLRTTVPEIERYVEPHGAIGAFLALRFKEYKDNHLGWSKPLWDMGAIAWMLDTAWTRSDFVPTPVMSDDGIWKVDPARHRLRCVRYVDRDLILRDFFVKLAAFAASDLSRVTSVVFHSD